ncbi:helix-turn-helix domain-containing protein [Aneurinibacillus aneurinilyticus]|uniref:helix-turn-helix domain-containing protein n=1 Tax=Aneurinibacillus aneurinilyticus TaxID=1391 RepID=UPI003525F891
MGFKERLKELRSKKGLTQEQLAISLDIPESTIRRYESVDDSMPRRERLEKIADFFDVQTDYLTGRTNDPSPKKSEKEMSLFFYDGLEGYDDLSPEEKEAFREHMYDEARQAIELVKKLKKQGKRGGMYER